MSVLDRHQSHPCLSICFFYHYTPVNHTDTHKRAPRQRERDEWMDGWMDGTCKPPKKGWKKTVSTLGRQSNTEFSPARAPSLGTIFEKREGVFFWFLASQQAASKEAAHSEKRKRNDLSLLSGTKVEPTKGMAKALSGNGKRLFVPYGR